MSILSFLLALLSGGFNGSYTYYLNRSKNIHLSWIAFGFLSFLLIPLIIFFISVITHNIFLSTRGISICLIVGLLFGSGMFLFSRAVGLIGVGIPFAINISLGTLSGGLFSSIVHKNISMIDPVTFLSYGLFMISIILCAVSLSLRENKNHKKTWGLGLFYALLSGVLCSFQGGAIGYFSDEIMPFSHHFFALIVPWVLIFLSCAFVFILGHAINYKKDQSKPIKETVNYRQPIKIGVLMCAFYMASIFIYNLATKLNTQFSAKYSWVIFMAMIIIASTAVAYLNKEWKNKSTLSISVNLFAILLIIISVGLLAYAALS